MRIKKKSLNNEKNLCEIFKFYPCKRNVNGYRQQRHYESNRRGKMMSALGIHHQNTFAFGDGLNDMEIINFVGTGVAMENGFEELKATADFVTDSVFNHGIANGLKKLELI